MDGFLRVLQELVELHSLPLESGRGMFVHWARG